MKRWRYHGRLFALEGISSLLQSRWASLLLYGLRVVLDWNLELSFVNTVLLSGYFFYISFPLFFFMHILAVCIGPFIYLFSSFVFGVGVGLKMGANYFLCVRVLFILIFAFPMWNSETVWGTWFYVVFFLFFPPPPVDDKQDRFRGGRWKEELSFLKKNKITFIMVFPFPEVRM